jgi:hypothetical protein
MSLGPTEVILIALFYVAPLLICIRLAPTRARGPLWRWVILALVFSWLAVLVLAVLRPAPGLRG